ncbi:hypothetical protein I552_0579 [Mycobacterium xenopi 3993]|nr:hypothetical protein I552_0579 [Mycobacterium xenopi 3993]
MKIETQADVERLMAERNISFVFRPSITEQPDGTWIACYPGADWSVSAATPKRHAERCTLRSSPECATPRMPIGRWKLSVGT